MIYKILVASTAIYFNEVSATYVFGKCPSIKKWSETHTEKLQPARIKGYWGSVWENNIKMLSAECQSMKIEQLNKKDFKRFKMYTGVSWKDLEEVVYDDSMVLVFDDPDGDSAKAAITNIEDVEMIASDTSKMQSYKMAPIDKDVEYRMDYQDVELYYQYQRELEL